MESTLKKKTRPPQTEAMLARLGHAVRNLREEQRITRKVLSDTTGLSARFIAQLEAGEGNISIVNLDLIAEALQTTIPGLLYPSIVETSRSGTTGQLKREIMQLLPASSGPSLRKALDVLQKDTKKPKHRPDAEKPLVALLGLRGAGKSTIGPLLAEKMKTVFSELDEIIQEKTGLAQGEIFELHGEAYYRDVERKALEDLLKTNQHPVIAVSGGIVRNEESFRLLRDKTRLVWLKASPELHMERVRSQGDQRPMENRPNAMAELRALLHKRTPYYEQAELVVDTSQVTPEQCAEALADVLAR